KIMGRIHEFEQKKQKRRKYQSIGFALAVVLLVFLPFSYPQQSLYGISKISANEYKLNVFGDEIYFNLFALVENPNRISFNEEMDTYVGFQKYFDVTSKLSVEMIEINGYIFLEVMKDEEVIDYLYVSNYDEKNLTVRSMEREFTDFKAEMTEVIELVERYPFELEIENDYCVRVNPSSERSNLSEEEIKRYEWFRELQGGVCSSNPITEYEYMMYFDGTVSDIGNLLEVSGSIGRRYDITKDDFPVAFKTLVPTQTFGTTREDKGISIKSTSFVFQDEKSALGATGLRIELGEYEFEDVAIEIILNGEEVKDSLLIEEADIVWLMPYMQKLKQDNLTALDDKGSEIGVELV
ncbi:MAG: hypothetical protein ACRCS6_05460, partial [Turicibacter sp.]